MLYEKVKDRLKSLGYEVTESDKYAIDFGIEKVEWAIKNHCNVEQVPEGLHHIVVDMACGEFLSVMKGCGKLPNFDVEGAIKSVKEGDTQITYAVDDTANPLDLLIDYLMHYGKSEFFKYRRLVW